MATQITGRADVFIDANKMGTVAGGTIKYGGEVRESVQGQFNLLGYKVTGVNPGGVDIEIAHTANLDTDDFDVTGAVLTIITDTGAVFLVNNATRVGDPPELNVDAGTITVTIEGDASIEI